MNIRWAVIGARGWAGRFIIDNAIIPSNYCELAAVQSRDKEAIKRLGTEIKAPWFFSVEEMLKKNECDAVYIASPQFVHLEHARLAARYKKHVFCEKPLALNSLQAEKMIMECEKHKVKLGIGFNLRFNNVHEKAKDLISTGAIGEVVSARCQYGQNLGPDPNAFRQKLSTSGGGSMIDMGNHAMDLIEYVTGKEYSAVMAICQNVIHDYEVEDTCGAILEFAEGGFAFVDSYYCMPINTLRNDLEVNGTLGTIYTVDSLRGMDTGGKMILIRQDKRDEYFYDGNNMYIKEFEAFCKAIIEGSDPPCSGYDGLRSQKILDAIYLSSKKKVKIKIL